MLDQGDEEYERIDHGMKPGQQTDRLVYGLAEEEIGVVEGG